MQRKVTDLIKILKAGGCVTVSASGSDHSQLIRIAAATKEGAMVHFTGVEGMSAEELSDIAVAGVGRVWFDL